MQLSSKYNPSEVEDKWYAYWLKYKCFHSEPDTREPYTIVIPPPNVTGILHMGHVLNNTLNDVLIRPPTGRNLHIAAGLIVGGNALAIEPDVKTLGRPIGNAELH